MRIKIIGENNCARATRHLLRVAGFAVTEFLPADAVTDGPLAGYAITIDLAPAPQTPDARLRQGYGGQAHLRPDPPTQHQQASVSEEASPSHRNASLPSLTETAAGLSAVTPPNAGVPAVAQANFRSESGIHFDSVDSALEAAVLRHVTQLAAAPVIVDRPGGVVHSDRELRIVAPNTGDAKADEAAAVAIEFGVLRGLLDLTAPASVPQGETTAGMPTHASPKAGMSVITPANFRSGGGKRKWWPFGIVLLAGALGLLRASSAAAPGRVEKDGSALRSDVVRVSFPDQNARLAVTSVAFVTKGHRLKPALLEAQGQFAMGQGLDPCKSQAKLYASINQTANTQLVTGAASKKIFVCSIHVVAAAATNVAVVEGTGSVCATGTTGVSGFGGATAATGWNFAANGGIALGNGDSSLGAEGTSGDNLCIFNSGSGQVSGGISYVVE